MNETRRKPTTGRQSPTLFDKWHGIFCMPSRIDEAGHTKAFDDPVAEHWGESQRAKRSRWDSNPQLLTPMSPKSNALPLTLPQLHRMEIQPLQMPVVIYSITKAKCPVYFYDCQLYQVSISTTTYAIYIFSEYIYYTYVIFVIGKDLLFQSASRLINRNKIHCKCCFHQGLVICILNCPF